MRVIAMIFLAALLWTHPAPVVNAESLRPLIEDLKSTDTETAIKAIKQLRESGNIRAVLPLLDAARDERGVVRQYAVEALQHLVKALDDVHMMVKRWLQGLINQLRTDPADEVITAARWSLDLRSKKA